MENKIAENNEMDLVDLIKYLWCLFVKYVVRPFLFMFKFGLRNWWKLAISAGVGLLLSYSFSKIEYFSVYKANLILQNNVARSSDFVNVVNELAIADPITLSNALGVEVDQLSYFRALKGHYFLPFDSVSSADYLDSWDRYLVMSKENGLLDISPIGHKFSIELQLTDVTLLPQIETGLLNYFENISYFKEANDIRVQDLEIDLRAFSAELMAVDSLKNIEYFENSRKQLSSPTDGGVIMSRATPMLHNDVLYLRKQVRQNQSKLHFVPNVLTVISDFKAQSLPKNHWALTMVNFVFFTIFFTYFILLAFAYRDKIRDFAFRK